MTEQQIQQATAQYEAKLRVWLSAQEGQQDSYEYEKKNCSFPVRLTKKPYKL